MNRKLRTIVCGATLVLACGLLLSAEARAEKKLLRLWLNGPVLEAPSDNAALMALFEKERASTLRDWVRLIHRAAADRDINGLVLILEQPEIGLAQVEELTQALKAFKAKDKPVYCYLDEASNAAYALAAAASHITLAENSELEIVGLHGEAMFFKGLLDKLGLEADMMHCGAYKSALEPFTRTEPSPEAAANINWLLDSLYERWIQLIADGRKLKVEDVRALVDIAPLSAKQALENKLVDDVSSFAAFKQRLHKEFGKDVAVLKKLEETTGPELDTSNPFTLIPQILELFEQASEPKEEPAVGLIYIEGGIVVGKSDAGPFGGNTAGSTTIRAAIEEARKDDHVKAVVLRVDSPGGSALASDIIWEAATRLAAEKPLMVSMGGVAGSGGYYVSLPGDTIFADPATITASIGVVGGKLIWKGLMESKLGITTTEFGRGKHAGLMSMNRRWDDGERAWMTEYMNSVYEQFKGRVTKSRGERLKKDLEEMAGGRVYTGAQAIDLGLVDKLGGLSDALDLAAAKANLGRDYRVQILPKPSGLEAFLGLLAKLTGQDQKDEFEVAAAAGMRADPLYRAALALVGDLAPAQVKELFRGLRNLLILQREKVGCFMPLVPEIR
jgi:protease-4